MDARAISGLRGRPTIYTVALAERICEQLCTGRTLRDVCRDLGMPDESTVRLWAQSDRDGFGARYRSAREIGYHAMADELLEIADDSRNDWIERQKANGNSEAVFDRDHVSRARLRVETRRWLLSKALPKIYGDRLDLKATHEAGDTLREVMKAIDGRTRGLP
jgi:terminase small subunit-like protein